MSGRVVSSRFPYLPLTLTVHGRTATIEALLDTGFDGDVAVPVVLVGEEVAADTHLRWTLADGSQARAPAYLGAARLGNFGPFPILLTASVMNRSLAAGSRIAFSSPWIMGNG